MLSATPVKTTSLRRPALAAVAALLFAATAQAADLSETKLVASDAAKRDLFGWSAAMSATTAIVGAPWKDNKQGAVYLYDTTTGAQTAKLTASDAADNRQFGNSVAISGTTAIIGAKGEDSSVTLPGAVYLFDTETGRQTAKLMPEDGTSKDLIITSVGVSGSTAIVGALVDVVGTAFLFDIVTGDRTAKLTASDVVAGDLFGGVVAISGATAIVGASWKDNSTGAAYLFDTKTGKEIAKLTASDAAEQQYFGSAVAISGTTAIVGAFANEDHGPQTGAAYLFDTTTGKQIAKLTAGNAAQGDMFGFSVAIAGSTAIVGANQTALDKGAKPGEAFLFDATTGAEITRLTASDGAADDRFGNAVAISETAVIVGANGSDGSGDASGSAYLFRRH
ncbi:MAG: hypothetical protein Kilf2KO_29240 [Rhodospirillales bacterium]